MVATLRDLLAYGMQRGNAVRRNLRALVEDPGGVLSLWGRQAAEDMTTPQQRATLAGQQPFQVQDPALRQKMLDLALQALTVYHGSPYKFAPEPGKPLGSFRSDKIGTGEGAQAYGYGHYVAESPAVAKSYAEAGTVGANPVVRKVPGSDSLWSVVSQDGRTSRTFYSEAEAMEAAKRKPVLYKADLADDAIPKMLDWDKPLSQQSENVRKRLLELYDKNDAVGQAIAADYTGQQLYELISDITEQIRRMSNVSGKQKAASEFLSKQGIPGIRYLDANSRGLAMAGEVIGAREQSLMTKIIDAQNAGNKTLATKLTKELENLKPLAKPTYNYVVFPGNEDLLKILERQ